MSLLYKECARIISLAVAGRGSVKSLCLTTKNKAKTKVYAIVFNVLQNYSVLKKIAEDADISCCPLVYVHLYELLYRGGLKTGGTLKTQLTKMLPRLKELKSEHQNGLSSYKRLPLYVRINTLKPRDPVDTVKQLQSDFPGGSFSGDPQVNFLLKFPPTTNFSQNSMYRAGEIILQDKASCLPGVALNPPKCSTVLDACSAPGNKTLHLAALMEDTGTVYAVERDRKRFARLKGNVKKHGASNIVPVCTDFLEISPKDSAYSAVTHLLVDPSCSGSGMVTENLVTNFQPVDAARLKTLSDLQKRLLTHALSFPCAERVVYSTCSVYTEENECVVREVLEASTDHWELVKVLPNWLRRGDTAVFEQADKCVRCLPEDETNGFFLACFVRKCEKGWGNDFLAGKKIQSVFSVKHLAMRYRIKHHYKHPYKFVKIY